MTSTRNPAPCDLGGVVLKIGEGNVVSVRGEDEASVSNDPNFDHEHGYTRYVIIPAIGVRTQCILSHAIAFSY